MATATLLAPSPAPAQARRVTAPAGNYLLDLTRGWARASPLGDLQGRRMGSGDVELRFWSGYGSAGTHALVLRKTFAGWAAWRAAVHYCELVLPHGVGDTLTRASVQRYQAEARRRCGEPRQGSSGVVITADTLEVLPLEAGVDLAVLWEELEGAGLLRLPPQVARERDGGEEHTYVVEVRRGDEYRASVIGRVAPPQTDADRRVQRIDALLAERLGDGR
ncbi:MAG TPA: hypothetical protein VNA89_13680 [Gemmatimonadaceae bacterium]|nr:hypothetical protein [Gemmatimonadaceae bacterium]